MMARETHNMSYLLEPCMRACVQLAAQASYGAGGDELAPLTESKGLWVKIKGSV